MSTYLSLSERLCSCQKPNAWRSSWIMMPTEPQPSPIFNVCSPPSLPTVLKHLKENINIVEHTLNISRKEKLYCSWDIHVYSVNPDNWRLIMKYYINKVCDFTLNILFLTLITVSMPLFVLMLLVYDRHKKTDTLNMTIVLILNSLMG